jgi:Methyltransferase FkbM domain
VETRRIRPPDVIKLDVEGHGFEALSGAEAAIRATKPAIIASIHSPQEAEGVRRVLAPLGYACRALDEAKSGASGWEACPKGGEFLLAVGAP